MHCPNFLNRLLVLTAIVFVAGATVAMSADDPQPLALNQVPKAVRDAVMKRFPEAKPQSAAQGTEDNRPYIDVIILVKTQKIWVTCDPDGTIRVVDREISVKDLPQQVATTLNKKYPAATIRLVNEITEDSAPVYDIAITINKKNLIATFAASGEFLEELDDEL
jgi:hypothetical protein